MPSGRAGNWLVGDLRVLAAIGNGPETVTGGMMKFATQGDHSDRVFEARSGSVLSAGRDASADVNRARTAANFPGSYARGGIA
jgi:hypothetical protein